MRAHHISTNLIHSRKRYQGRCPSLISFIGMIPITVGKIAPTHQRKAQLTALFRVGSSPNVRSVTPATIAKLRKIRDLGSRVVQFRKPGRHKIEPCLFGLAVCLKVRSHARDCTAGLWLPRTIDSPGFCRRHER